MKYIVIEYEDIQLPEVDDLNFKPAVMSFSHLERCECVNGDVRIINLCDGAASFHAKFYELLGAWVVKPQTLPDEFKDCTPISRRYIIGNIRQAMEYMNV